MINICIEVCIEQTYRNQMVNLDLPVHGNVIPYSRHNERHYVEGQGFPGSKFL